MQLQPRMGTQELTHRSALVPAGTVDVEGELQASQAPIEIAQHVEETFAVTELGADHAVATQQRGHPAGQVESAVVLAVGGYAQTLSAPGPTEAQARMQSEARFVLKDPVWFGSRRCSFF